MLVPASGPVEIASYIKEKMLLYRSKKCKPHHKFQKLNNKAWEIIINEIIWTMGEIEKEKIFHESKEINNLAYIDRLIRGLKLFKKFLPYFVI